MRFNSSPNEREEPNPLCNRHEGHMPAGSTAISPETLSLVRPASHACVTRAFAHTQPIQGSHAADATHTARDVGRIFSIIDSTAERACHERIRRVRT